MKKQLKTKDNILKTTREKQHVYRRAMIWLMAVLSETVVAKRHWKCIFKGLKEENPVNQEVYIQSEVK